MTKGIKKDISRTIKVPRFKKELGFETTVSRSRLMSKIHSVNTTPELHFRKKLWALGLRYRVNSKNLPGKPDIVIKKFKAIIFIDGEFWHGYNWEEKKERIKSNRKFWIPKIERNMQRDIENNIILKKMGFKVFRFWENEIKKNTLGCVRKVTTYINKLR